MLDRIFGLLGNTRAIQGNDGLAQSQDFKRALQLSDSDEVDQIGNIPNNFDVNSLKLRGSIHDMAMDPAMQGAISRILNDPQMLGGLMALIKQKLGGQAV